MVSNRLNRLKSSKFSLIFRLLALAHHKVVSVPYSSHCTLRVVGSTSVGTLEVEGCSQWRKKHYLIVYVMFIGDHSAVLMNKEKVKLRKGCTRTSSGRLCRSRLFKDQSAPVFSACSG